MARFRRIPIFAPEQLTPEMRTAWNAFDTEKTAYLECLPLRNPDGSVVVSGPCGYLDVESEA